MIVEAGRRITVRHVRQIEKAKVKKLEVPVEYLLGKVLATRPGGHGHRRAGVPGQ